MSFLNIIFKNVWRHRTRTLMTVLGISIGIATIVVFGLIASGMRGMFGDLIKPGKTDFTVAKADSIDMIVSFLTPEQNQTIQNVPGVAQTIPYVMGLAGVGGNPYFLIGGIEASQLKLVGGNIIEGRAYENDNEIIIGKITAKNHKLKVGDHFTINNKQYDITGIFESGITYQDSGAITTITEAQRIQGVKDQYTVIMVKTKEGSDVSEVAKAVEASDKNFVSIIDINDFNAADQQLKMIDGVSWAISLLAIIIGGIGVMNTIIMSIFERVREIGVLRAIGWKKYRILMMIMGESIIIGILSAIIGIFLGIAIVLIIMQTEIGKSWLNIDYQPIVFIRAIAVSLIVVILGAIYPAYKASKLQPTEALRYE